MCDTNSGSNNVYLEVEQRGDIVTLVINDRGYADSVEISPDDDNQLESRLNGLYVKPYSWSNKEW